MHPHSFASPARSHARHGHETRKPNEADFHVWGKALGSTHPPNLRYIVCFCICFEIIFYTFRASATRPLVPDVECLMAHDLSWTGRVDYCDRDPPTPCPAWTCVDLHGLFATLFLTSSRGTHLSEILVPTWPQHAPQLCAKSTQNRSKSPPKFIRHRISCSTVLFYRFVIDV